MQAPQRRIIKTGNAGFRMYAGMPERFIGKDIPDAGNNILPEKQRLYHAPALAESRDERIFSKALRVNAEATKIGILLELIGRTVPNDLPNCQPLQLVRQQISGLR